VSWIAAAIGAFLLLVPSLAMGCAATPVQATDGLLRVTSKDGTPIAFQCAGTGPTLLFVHGGIGDRTRWTPIFPFLSSRLEVCVMDRRGHGASGDARDYDLSKEAEDVVAVVQSRNGRVSVFGHSYGAVAALEAAFLTDQIGKLLLYEPPLQDRIESTVADRLEASIRRGERASALETFFLEVVKLSPAEVAAMHGRPSWPDLVAGVDRLPRQIRALAGYRFDPERMRRLRIPTLLLSGGDTRSPELKHAIESLSSTLPHASRVVLAGQEHNAMDSARPQLASAISTFLR
jgi:pimeloyl-ACP methyl ester carboxylesterase